MFNTITWNRCLSPCFQAPFSVARYGGTHLHIWLSWQSFRPAWSTWWILGLPGLRSETVFQKTNKIKQINKQNQQIYFPELGVGWEWSSMCLACEVLCSSPRTVPIHPGGRGGEGDQILFSFWCALEVFWSIFAFILCGSRKAQGAFV